jgi:hypothetical protein
MLIALAINMTPKPDKNAGPTRKLMNPILKNNIYMILNIELRFFGN